MTERKLKYGFSQLLDEDGAIIGGVGTVKALCKAGIFTHCEYPGNTWACLPIDRKLRIQFADTKEKAIEYTFGKGFKL